MASALTYARTALTERKRNPLSATRAATAQIPALRHEANGHGQPDGLDTKPSPHVRLTVNLARPVADALRYLAEQHSQSITEEVRTAITLLYHLDKEIQEGSKITVEGSGRSKELLLLDVLRLKR